MRNIRYVSKKHLEIIMITIITDTVKYLFQIGALCFLHNYYAFVIVLLISQILNNILTAIVSNRMFPEFKPKGKLPKEEIKKINELLLACTKNGGKIIKRRSQIENIGIFKIRMKNKMNNEEKRNENNYFHRYI